MRGERYGLDGGGKLLEFAHCSFHKLTNKVSSCSSRSSCDRQLRYFFHTVVVLVTSDHADTIHKYLESVTPVCTSVGAIHTVSDGKKTLLRVCRKKSRFTKGESRIWSMTVVVDEMGADKATNGLKICNLSILCLCLTYRRTSKFLLTSVFAS